MLHVPSFQFNLISVSSLLCDNNCSAHFYPTHCFFQDVSQDLMIGKGNVLHNLYILDVHAFSEHAMSSAFCGSLSADGKLWHQRLGHPSLAKLQVLSDITFSS